MSYLKEQFAKYGDLEIDAPLSKHTTFRIGGKAKYFIYPKNEMSLLRVVEICQENDIEYRVFGKGSNILCSDHFFDGCIINLDRYFTDYQFEEDGSCFAQAGVSLILLAHGALKNALSGLEFASGIPATLGGAIYMNAGAYRSDMASVVQKVYVLKNDKYEWMNVSELEFSYRHSAFHEHRDWIIIGAHLTFVHGVQNEIKDLMDSRRQRRMDSQPLDKPCAGSIFRNHEDYPAWKVIDEIGYRGRSLGGAQVSEKHSNFIVNAGGATAEDVVQLAREIQAEVRAKFNIQLTMEVETFNWHE